MIIDCDLCNNYMYKEVMEITVKLFVCDLDTIQLEELINY